jgi:transcription elongation factor Elf1
LGIISCPGCSHSLRVPDGKRGTATCPRCGAEWFHPEAIELSDVEFRCSTNGARFNVVSSRRSPRHKFVIQKITKPTSNEASPSSETPVAVVPQSAVEGIGPLPVAAPKTGGWLSLLTGRKAVVTASVQTSVVPQDRPADRAMPHMTQHSMDEYNWTGFSCPYCSAPSFVSCSGGHLACDGTAKVRSGRRFHQCFCGQAGFISGTIRTVESRRLSVKSDKYQRTQVTAEAQVDRPDIALPAPTHGRSPAKR